MKNKLKLIREVNTLTSLRLSETQKEVMCKIIAAETEELAYEESSTGVNIIAARDQLADLGLLDWSEGTASITETGMKVLRDEALVDEADQLSEEGNKYAYGEEGDAGGLENPDQQGEDPQMQGDEFGPDADVPQTREPDPFSSGDISMDMDTAGFRLIKHVNDQVLAEKKLFTS